MGCAFSCMKKMEDVKNEVEGNKQEYKKRRWWKHITSRSRVSDSYVSSDRHCMREPSSSTPCSSIEQLLVPSTAASCPPVDISHGASSLSLDEVHGHNHSESTRMNNLQATAGIASGTADKYLSTIPEERLVAVHPQADACIQCLNVMRQRLRVLRTESEIMSGQREGRSHNISTASTHIQQLGFPNIWNTCYMNATLQCLLSLSCFWSPIRAQRSSWTDPYSCQMLRCFADLQQARLNSCSTWQKHQLLRALITCVSACYPTFRRHCKQDAHEFLMLCLLQLKEEGETLSMSCFSYICPVANFEFILKSVRTCASCGLQSSRAEDFNQLSLSLSSTLTESLQIYFKPTVVEFFCECGQGRSASEVVEFFTLPRVLILHVKRFNMLGQKLTDVMDIPAELDLSTFPGVTSLRQLSNGPAGSQHSPPEKQEGEVEEDSSSGPVTNVSAGGQGETEPHPSLLESAPTGTYRLHGVVCHLGGGINSGHYISHVAEGDGKSWLSFNDSIVLRMTEPAVLQHMGKTAYVLFYVHSGAGEKNVVPWKEEQWEVAGSS